MANIRLMNTTMVIATYSQSLSMANEAIPKATLSTGVAMRTIKPSIMKDNPSAWLKPLKAVMGGITVVLTWPRY